MATVQGSLGHVNALRVGDSPWYIANGTGIGTWHALLTLVAHDQVATGQTGNVSFSLAANGAECTAFSVLGTVLRMLDLSLQFHNVFRHHRYSAGSLMLQVFGDEVEEYGPNVCMLEDHCSRLQDADHVVGSFPLVHALRQVLLVPFCRDKRGDE